MNFFRKVALYEPTRKTLQTAYGWSTKRSISPESFRISYFCLRSIIGALFSQNFAAHSFLKSKVCNSILFFHWNSRLYYSSLQSILGHCPMLMLYNHWLVALQMQTTEAQKGNHEIFFLVSFNDFSKLVKTRAAEIND